MNNSRSVYSTDGGRVGPKTPPRKSVAQRPAPQLPDDGVVRIFREKNHRGGKTVTVIRGLPAARLEPLAGELKRLCGAGGTLREGAIEIQGDHRDKVAAKLTTLGFKVKLAGG